MQWPKEKQQKDKQWSTIQHSDGATRAMGMNVCAPKD
jgi:hypothetical protein